MIAMENLCQSYRNIIYLRDLLIFVPNFAADYFRYFHHWSWRKFAAADHGRVKKGRSAAAGFKYLCIY